MDTRRMGNILLEKAREYNALLFSLTTLLTSLIILAIQVMHWFDILERIIPLTLLSFIVVAGCLAVMFWIIDAMPLKTKRARLQFPWQKEELGRIIPLMVPLEAALATVSIIAIIDPLGTCILLLYLNFITAFLWSIVVELNQEGVPKGITLFTLLCSSFIFFLGAVAACILKI